MKQRNTERWPKRLTRQLAAGGNAVMQRRSKGGDRTIAIASRILQRHANKQVAGTASFRCGRGISISSILPIDEYKALAQLIPTACCRLKRQSWPCSIAETPMSTSYGCCCPPPIGRPHHRNWLLSHSPAMEWLMRFGGALVREANVAGLQEDCGECILFLFPEKYDDTMQVAYHNLRYDLNDRSVAV